MTRSELYLAAVWAAQQGRKPQYKNYDLLVQEWKSKNPNWESDIKKHETLFK